MRARSRRLLASLAAAVLAVTVLIAAPASADDPSPVVTPGAGECVAGEWVATAAVVTLPAGPGRWLWPEGHQVHTVSFDADPGEHVFRWRARTGEVTSSTVTVAPIPPGECAAPVGFVDDDASPAIVADSDRAAVELGARFTPTSPGLLTGVQVYQGSALERITRVTVWGPGGTVIARQDVPASTVTGWRTIVLDAPVRLDVTEYIVSYHAATGRYAAQHGVHDQARGVPGFTLPAGAGVYRYGDGRPDSSYRGSSYFVDVVYTPDVPSTTPTPTPTLPSATATPTPTATPTTVPPVPGGLKNCINVPSACGYPDETNTGVKPGSTLTRVPQDATSGPGWSWRADIRAVQTTGNGATLENLSIDAGSVIVLHSGVTIRNAYVRSTDYYPVNCVYGGVTRDADSCLGLIVEDVEIAGTAQCQAALAFNGYTARRVYAHGCLDGFKANSDVVIEDSYVTDLAVVAGSHNDGVQSTAQGNLTFRHNTFKLGNQSGINAVFQMGMKDRVGTGVTIENSLIDGGGWMINSSPIPDGRLVGNRFTRRSTWGIGEVKGGSWVGNYWDDTLAPIPQNR